MTNELQNSKYLRSNWIAYALILAVFVIDCLLGNAYKIINSGDYVDSVHQYVSYKEVFGIFPYVLLIIISLNLKVRFDKFDMAILFTCLFLQVLNCADFFINNNWRPVWTDWALFFIIFVPATLFKVLTYFKKTT